MSNAKLTLRPPPNLDFVHGYPGVPPDPNRPQAAVKGTVELQTPPHGVFAKWVRIELRKAETLPGGGDKNTFYDCVGLGPVTLWSASDEYNVLHTRDFPFSIRIPESIPPSIVLDNRAGIQYELIATACAKQKRGFLREKDTIIAETVPLIIDKHELHSTWPIYNRPEKRQLTQKGITLEVERGQTCYGPGDRILVVATLKSAILRTLVLSGFEITLKESTIFNTIPGKAPLMLLRYVAETKTPVNAVLYRGEMHQAELACQLPPSHSTTTLNAARHIDVTYVLSVKALMSTGTHVAMDLPVKISNWPRNISQEAIRRIGPVPALSLVIPSPATSIQSLLQQSATVSVSLDPPHRERLPPSRRRDNASIVAVYDFDGVGNSTYPPSSESGDNGKQFRPMFLPSKPLPQNRTTSRNRINKQWQSVGKQKGSLCEGIQANVPPTVAERPAAGSGGSGNLKAIPNPNQPPPPYIPPLSGRSRGPTPSGSRIPQAKQDKAALSKECEETEKAAGKERSTSIAVTTNSILTSRESRSFDASLSAINVPPPSFEDSVSAANSTPLVSSPTEKGKARKTAGIKLTMTQPVGPPLYPNVSTSVRWSAAEYAESAYEPVRIQVEPQGAAAAPVSIQDSSSRFTAPTKTGKDRLFAEGEQVQPYEKAQAMLPARKTALVKPPAPSDKSSTIGVLSATATLHPPDTDGSGDSNGGDHTMTQSVDMMLQHHVPGTSFNVVGGEHCGGETGIRSTPLPSTNVDEQIANPIEQPHLDVDDLSLPKVHDPNNQSQLADTTHAFRGAHHFVINNPVMASIINPENEALTMRLLLQKGNVDASLDSSARFPPPLCHPSTRQKLRERILEWLSDTNRSSSLLWLHGPAGAGKTAIAQTIAEHCMARGWLGAAFFFSRSNNRNDPQEVIPTLAYQLAVTYTAYKQLATHILTEDPSILDKMLRIQFTKLIIEPLSFLKSKGATAHPILILLDGLDECEGDASQRDFIKLVGEFTLTAKARGLPFVWILTSRPEWHIISTFSGTNPQILCHREELQINTPEALADVSNFLRDGFGNIRRKYSDAFTAESEWPTEDQLLTIRSAASGLILFVSTLLKFVDDGEIGNPVSQLEVCLEFLKGNLLPKGGNPLNPLDSLYSGILRAVHPNILPTLLQILSVLLFVPETFPAQTVANFLFLDQATFYGSLRKLYSILIVPPPESAGTNPLVIINTSFGEFLKHMSRSGDLGISKGEASARIEQSCVRWLDIRARREARKDIESHDKFLAGIVPWYCKTSFNHITNFAGRRLWSTWSGAAEEDMPRLCEDLRRVNFANYDQINSRHEPMFTLEGNTPHFAAVILKLYRWETENRYHGSYNLLRYKPRCPTDMHLLRDYAYLINHAGMAEADLRLIESDTKQRSFMCLSLDTSQSALHNFGEVRRALLDPNPMYFLLGHNTNTGLIIGYRHDMDIHQFLSASFQQIRIIHSIRASEGEPWPTPDHVKLITSAVTLLEPAFQFGQPSLLRTIVAFLTDLECTDPVGRLDWILDVLATYDEATKIVDVLHERVLSDTPQHIRPTVLRVLAFVVCRVMTFLDDFSETILLHDISRFFIQDEDTVKKALQTVNLLVSSCPLPSSTRAVLDFYEPGLSVNSDRWLSTLASEPQVWSEISAQYIYWLDHVLMSTEALEGPDPVRSEPFTPRSSYKERQENEQTGFERLLFNGCHWAAFSQVAKDGAAEMANELRELRFSQFPLKFGSFFLGTNLKRSGLYFGEFVNKFYSYQAELDLGNIIRVERNCDADDQLLAGWQRMGLPFRPATLPIDFSQMAYAHFISVDCVPYLRVLNHDDTGSEFEIFLLGYEENSCLVVLEPALWRVEENLVGGLVDTRRLGPRLAVVREDLGPSIC